MKRFEKKEHSGENSRRTTMKKMFLAVPVIQSFCVKDLVACVSPSPDIWSGGKPFAPK